MTTALIGRDHPAGVLRAEIRRASESHGGLVLVTGEAGIGKTTLVTGAVEEARRLGALVLSGSCWDSDSAPGYWPWVQVIRALRRASGEVVDGNGLAVLLGDAASAEPVDSFTIYDAVTSALVAASARQPVVVVLDDLHWADTASLRLLEFAAQHTWFERLLLVGTYRDVEVEAAGHPLQPLLTALVAKATTVTLTGLDPDEVGALMARTTGTEPGAELIGEVHRRTGGNPFFVEQTARLWRSGGSVTAVAPGVREALRRRMSLLPPPVVELLTAAAVLGREFHRQVLAATLSSPVPHVDRLLDQAVTARLVVAQGAGMFSFAHDLVRETLYDALGEEAAGQHAAVVHALERTPTLAVRIFAADLARHAYLAGAALDPAIATDHLVAAARDAGTRMATEEAIGHYRRALERVTDAERRVRISLDLGQQLHHVNDRDSAWQSYETAVTVARQVGDDELLTRVALTLYMYDSERGGVVESLLDDAHRALVRGGADAPEPLSTDRLARELSVHMMALARGGDDDDALTFSLWARHDTIWGLGTAAERVTLTDELMAVARRSGDHGVEHFASSLRWVALLEQGDPRYVDQFHDFIALAERHGLARGAFSAAVDKSLIAAFQGRFAEADTLLDQALNAVEDHMHEHFTYMGTHMRWSYLLLQGRFDELADVQRLLIEHKHPYPRMLAGITAVQRGDVDEARRLFTESQAGGNGYERMFAPLALRFQAQVAAATADPGLCARTREALAPHRGQWVVSLYGCDLSGPVDLWLALVDAAQERWDDAIEEFTAAYQAADRLRARPWSLEARAGLARTLLATGDVAAGEALAREVRDEAAELGMRHLAVDGPVVAEAPANAFHRDGSVWSVGTDGHAVHVPDSKGLRDLHHLISQPGVDVPAVRLLDPDGGEVVVAARRLGGDDVLDDEAKARYKRRLTRLDEEIDRAAERGDDARAAAFDQERAALLEQLRTAAGLGGRTRRLGDEAERARKTVTARIRDAIRKLDERHPGLAAHLRASVTTGATCRYQPDHPVRWRL